MKPPSPGEPKPLLNFSTEKMTPESFAKFQHALVADMQRRLDELAEELRGTHKETRLMAKHAEVHVELNASRMSLRLEEILDRIERLERTVRRLEKPRSGISGLFRRPDAKG